MVQGKIRDDVDFVERLENMPKSELKDWKELDRCIRLFSFTV